MLSKKIIAVLAVVIIAVAAIGVVGFYKLGDDAEAEKKGLYMLDPVVSVVDMGKCSATPAVIITIEDMYREYYGDLVKGDLTLADAQADTEFWNTYCNWSSITTPNGNGTYNVEITTNAKGSEIVTIPVCDVLVTMGTMYSETLYYLACMEFGVEPYSNESYENQDVVDYMKDTILGGMQYSYYESEKVEYILKTIDKSSYLDLGVNSVQTLDPEKLANALTTIRGETSGNIMYFASGARMTTGEYYNNNTMPVKNTTNAYYAFFAPSQIKEMFSAVECIGLLMGFSDEVISELIEDIQLRLYKVYYSVQEKTEGQEKAKAYWEGSSGKAISSAMGKVILNFLGFDTSLLDGAEHDLESLIVADPSYIVFYTNDGRTLDEMMRVNN